MSFKVFDDPGYEPTETAKNWWWDTFNKRITKHTIPIVIISKIKEAKEPRKRIT